MPIAFSAAAESLNTTTQELYKLIETGKVTSVEFGPNFAKTVRSYVKDSGMLDAAMNTSRVSMIRMVTVFKENVLGAFDAGAESGLASFFNNLSSALEDLAPATRTLGRVFGFLVSTLGVVIKVVTTLLRPFGMLWDAFKTSEDTIENSDEKLGKFSTSLETLKSILSTLAAVILTPFAILENTLDVIQEKINNLPFGKKSLEVDVAANMATKYSANSGKGSQVNIVKGDTKYEIYSNDPTEIVDMINRKVKEEFDFVGDSLLGGAY